MDIKPEMTAVKSPDMKVLVPVMLLIMDVVMMPKIAEIRKRPKVFHQ